MRNTTSPEASYSGVVKCGPVTRLVQETDPLYFVRERSRAMFEDGTPSGSVLMSNIAFGAAALGAGHVEICNADAWWFAASETNWLERQLPPGFSTERLFRTPTPFPLLGPNSDRPEIYVGAFADSVYLDLNGKHQPIQGRTPDPLPHIGVVPPWCVFVLGCHVPVH